MAKLTSKERNSLPKSEFGLPGSKAYPMPYKSHAGNAKASESQAVNAGRMSKSTESKIDTKADRILGDTMKQEKKESGYDKRKDETEKMKGRHEKEKRMETKPAMKKESKTEDKKNKRRGEMDMIKSKYEKSKFDKDKGVKEGSPADLKRDKVGIKLFIKEGEMPGGAGSIADRQKEAKDRAMKMSKK